TNERCCFASFDQFVQFSEVFPGLFFSGLFCCLASRGIHIRREKKQIRFQPFLTSKRPAMGSSTLRNMKRCKIFPAPDEARQVRNVMVLERSGGGPFHNEIAMFFLEGSTTFTGEDGCRAVDPVFEGGRKFVDSTHPKLRTSRLRITI